MEIDSILSLEPAAFLQAAYRFLLGRDAEHEAIESCVGRLADGMEKKDILREIACSDEAINRSFLLERNEALSQNDLRETIAARAYPKSLRQWLNMEGESFIRASYYVLLGREPDDEGLRYYGNLLRRGARKSHLIARIANSTESKRHRPEFPGLENIVLRERVMKLPVMRQILKKIDLEFLPSHDDSSSNSLAAYAPLPTGISEENPEVLSGSLRELINSHLERCAALLLSSRHFPLATESDNAIAVVSVKPFDKTGISNFNRQTFSCASHSVDFFADFDSVHEMSSSSMAGDKGDYRYFHIDFLSSAILQRRYRAIIFVLGNSDHNFPVAKAIRQFKNIRPNTKVFVHVHDAILLNLCKLSAAHQGDDYAEVSRSLLTHKLPAQEIASLPTISDSVLVNHGTTGINYLLKDFHHDGIIFNSEAARDFFKADMVVADEKKMHVLFHPVFEPFAPKARESRRDRHIRIGTFGVPGGDKRTLDVCRAFDIFHQKYPNSSFVLAGFHARSFALANNIENGRNGYLIDEPATTDELLELMQSCDIAIQLRLANNGESSGVVPQLLAKDVNVIATRVGSFCAFGEAVTFVESNISVQQLAELIYREVNKPSERSTHRARFVQEHSPLSFMEQLDQIIFDQDVRAENLKTVTVRLPA